GRRDGNRNRAGERLGEQGERILSREKGTRNVFEPGVVHTAVMRIGNDCGADARAKRFAKAAKKGRRSVEPGQKPAISARDGVERWPWNACLKDHPGIADKDPSEGDLHEDNLDAERKP